VSADVNPGSPARAGVPPATFAAAAVAVVVLLGFLGYQALTPKVYAPPVPPNIGNPSQDAFNAWARQRYRETGGAWAKLPPEDQQRFMNASRGKGKFLFDSFKP
jgi:hypothetical protein